MKTTLDNYIYVKIFSCFLHAHFMNSANLGTYKELNKIFSLNNLPTMKIPTVPQSDKIISKFVQAEDHKTKQNEEVTHEEEETISTIENQNNTETLKGSGF